MTSQIPVFYFRFKLQTSNFKLQTSNFKLQTSNFKLQTSNFKLQTSNFKLQTSNFKLQTSNFKLQTSNFKLQTSNFKLQTMQTQLFQLKSFRDFVNHIQLFPCKCFYGFLFRFSVQSNCDCFFTWQSAHMAISCSF